MLDTKRNNQTGNVILPDWLGSGQDLFGTIQIIKGKNIDFGFLEIDFDFKFSETFNYPIVFKIETTDEGIKTCAIAFRIDRGTDKAKRKIEENIIAPKVCTSIRQDDFIAFLADVIERNIDFALYLNKTPKKFKHIKFFKLSKDQQIILEERLVMKITEVLDRRRR